MPTWIRYTLFALGVLLLLLAGTATWLWITFDAERIQRVAVEWVRTHHGRELSFEAPVTLQLWPQPALAIKDVRLSEAGRAAEPFAVIEHAALSLHLRPLLQHQEVVVDRITARGVKLNLRRDADGRRNIDDLLIRLEGRDPAATPGGPLSFNAVELKSAELQVADALAGVHGRLFIQELNLGRFGPGLHSPLRLRARAEMQQPSLDATLELKAGVGLEPASRAGAAPALRLARAELHLQGNGFDFRTLDAHLQAKALRVEDGTGSGAHGSQVEVDDAVLGFSGERLGWQIDAGQLRLAQLRLNVSARTLALGQGELTAKGRRDGTTLDARMAWPAIEVVGDRLVGEAIDGRLQLGGDRRLLLQLQSKAPTGSFERITLPQLRVDIDGQLGGSSVKGHAETALVFEPMPRAVVLEPLSLALRIEDPGLPPLSLALSGTANLTPTQARALLRGQINGQRVDGRVDASLGPPRHRYDIEASFDTLDLARFVSPQQQGAAPAPTPDSTAVSLQALQLADARLQLRAARLLWPPYRIDELDLQARIDNGALALQRLNGRAWGGRFQASGTADARSSQLALRVRADNVDVRALLNDTAGSDVLRGRGRVDADLRSRGSTVGALRAALQGRVSLTLGPAAISGVDLTQTFSGWRQASASNNDLVAADARRQTDFSALSASFDLVNGIGRSTDFDGRSEFLRLSGEGTIDLVQARMDYLLRARVVNTSGGQAGPEMALLNGVTVPVEVNGPFGSLQWQVRWATVTAAVTAMAVPNLARGAVGGVARGATGVFRGAAGLLRGSKGTETEPAAPSR